MEISDLIGTWKLISFELENPEGIRKPWGEGSTGLLIYSSDGFMSASINNTRGIKKAETSDEILDSILFYSGTFTLNDNELRHQVIVASDPHRVGQELTRFASLIGNQLTLISPKQPWGRGILIWEKANRKFMKNQPRNIESHPRQS